jgi:hypothetical protein
MKEEGILKVKKVDDCDVEFNFLLTIRILTNPNIVFSILSKFDRWGGCTHTPVKLPLSNHV